MLVFLFCFCSPLVFTHVDGAAIDTILKANKNLLNDNTLREGDIKMRTENDNKQNDPVDPVIYDRYLWPGDVPYTLSSDFVESEKTTIRSSFALITAAFKCVKFTEYSLTASNIPTNYVEVIKSDGCWSYVGMNGGKQQMSLGTGCIYPGTIVHEMLHALGFYHEQSRPDRNDYVTINTANIEDGQEDNFAISNDIGNMNVPYDPDSVMHYGRTAFSKNGEPTIVWKADTNRTLGGEMMTEFDILQLHLVYQNKLTLLGVCECADRSKNCLNMKAILPGLCEISSYKKLCGKTCGQC